MNNDYVKDLLRLLVFFLAAVCFTTIYRLCA